MSVSPQLYSVTEGCVKSVMAISGASNSSDVSPVPFGGSTSLGYFLPGRARFCFLISTKVHTICGRRVFVHSMIPLFAAASDMLRVSADFTPSC